MRRLKKTAIYSLFFSSLLPLLCLAGGPPPVITVQPTNQTVLLNGSVSFQVTATSGTALSYQWLKNGATISGATLNSFTMANVQTANAAIYSVQVVNGGGTVYSSNATLTVLVPAGITNQPQSQTVVQGQNVLFSVGASGTAPLTYRWNFNGTNLSGATNATLSLTNVQAAQAGSYLVVVTNSWGSATSLAAALTVNVPPSITTQPPSQSLAHGQTASFTVLAGGTGPLLYNWYFNGALFATSGGGSSSTITITNVQNSDAGIYTVVINNSWGSVTNSNAVLTVDVPAGIVSQPFSQTVTTGSNAVFSVVASGTAPFSYQWTFNGASLPGATNATLTLTNVQAGNAGDYAVTVMNSWGSVTSAAAPLLVLTGWLRVVVNINDSGAGSLRQAILDTRGGGSVLKTIAFNLTNAPVGGRYTINLLSALPTLTNYTAIDGYTQPGASRNTLAEGNNAVIKIILSGTAASAANGLNISLPGCAVSGLAIVNFPGHGLYPSGSGNAVIQGNFIGLDPDGVTARGNSGMGIRATAKGTVIGGTAPGQRNVISGNFSGGIQLQNSEENVVQGNFIGTDAAGTLARGNTGVGVDVRGVNSYGNLIGGTSSGAGNRIAFNTQAGVWVTDAVNNAVLGNSIFANGGLGIDLGAAGVQPNDAGDADSGANNLQNYPVLGSVTNRGGSLQIIGSLNSLTNKTYRLEFFSNPGPVAATNSEGRHFLGATTLTLATTATGNFTATFPSLDSGDTVVIATATDPTNNTSEFSPAAAIVTSVNAILTLTTQPQSQTVTAGQNVLFSVAAGGTTPFSYQWTFNGVNLDGATNAMLTLTSVQASHAGSYSVIVTNVAGSVTSSNATLTVNVPPTIAPQPLSQTATAGQNVLFSVGAGGTAPFSYQWTFNGTNLAGATSSTLALTSVQTNNTGTYSVVVTNVAGSVTSFGATLTVNVPASITTQPLSQTVTIGQTVSFSVVPGGTAPFSYQWTFNGTNLAGATGSTLTLNNVQTNNAGTYSVVVTNVAGSVTSSGATLTVNVPAGITTQPLSQTAVAGQNVSFSVMPGGTAPFSYQWTFNGTNLDGATGSTLTLNSVQTNDVGTYSVTVTNVAGSVTSSSATLTVNVPASITTQPLSQPVTVGQNVSFSVVPGGTAPFSYQWTFNGTNLDGATSSTLALNNVQTNNAGAYSVTVTNVAGSATSSSATLTVNVPASITTQPLSQTATVGQNISFSVVPGGTAPFSYQWTCNGTNLDGATSSTLTLNSVQTNNVGTYSVTVTNVAGSVTSFGATLTVNVPASITTQPLSQTAVQGQNVSFSVGASGTSPFSYQWSFNGTNLIGATSSTLTLNSVQTNNVGTYSVTVTNVAGSVTSSSATLTVNVPASITTQPLSQTAVQGQNVSFSVVPSGTSPFSYQWTFNGTNLDGATSSTLALNNVQTNNVGAYSVTVTNVAGSVTSFGATLTVNVPASITTQPLSQTTTAGQTVSFSVVPGGTAPFSYQWTFNGTNLDGATGSILTLNSVQTNNVGAYSVTVTNVAGSVTSSSATLTVNVPASITTQPLSQTVTRGYNVVFAVVAGGTAPFTYQWTFNGTNLDGATNSTLNPAPSGIQTNNVGSYSVIVMNIAGSVTSAVATLTVNVPPSITNPPHSQSMASGQNTSFSVEPRGTAPFSYQWRHNGANLSGANSPTLVLNNVQLAAVGSYTVVVTNVAGSVISASAMLMVTNPIITLSVVSGAAMTPSGFTFQLSVPVGITYVILATTNLQDWTPISTNVSLTESVMFTDVAATNHPSRFYQVLVPNP